MSRRPPVIPDIRALADLVRRPLVTEKANRLLADRQYTFEVDPRATKPQIRAAIEYLFDVKVTAVNTLPQPPRSRRVGRFQGHKAHYKKAIVTLAVGSEIVLFPEV